MIGYVLTSPLNSLFLTLARPFHRNVTGDFLNILTIYIYFIQGTPKRAATLTCKFLNGKHPVSFTTFVVCLFSTLRQAAVAE